MPKTSIIIPARNERYLQQTLDSLLTNAQNEIEILVCLDGWWPNPPLKEDPRVRVLHWSEALGMRPITNAAVKVARGDFLMKLDAHCIVGPGFDAVLQSSCDAQTLVIPTRHSIEPKDWTVKPRNYNYHILTYPYLASMYGAGLHAITFAWDENKVVNAEREQVAVDDLMSFQGSCWFQRRADFERLGDLDHENYYFYQEAQEVGLRVWMTGGRCVIDKRTWYAHMHKGHDHQGADGRVGRGFFLDLKRKRASEAFATDYWIHDRWPGATRTFVSLVEQFWPLLARMQDPRYAWPANWRDFEHNRRWFENRPVDQLPAHI